MGAYNGGYGGSGGSYSGAYTGDDAQFTGATPYVEQDKSSRTTAIFQGISGVLQSAGDFYQRIKYNVQPVPGGYGTSNAFWGGGVSYVPGRSGEPIKLAAGGSASPMLLIVVAAVVLIVLLKR